MPQEPREEPGKWASIALTIGVHLLLVLFLYLGVQWKSKDEQESAQGAVMEVWNQLPPPPQPVVEPPRPTPPAPPPPPVPVHPAPIPEPTRAPDIAIKHVPPPKHPVKEEVKQPPVQKPVKAPEPKPEQKPETKAKPELKPEVKPEPKPEIKPQPKDKPVPPPPKETPPHPAPREFDFSREAAKEQTQREIQKGVQDERRRENAAKGFADDLKGEGSGGRGDPGYGDRIRAKVRSNMTEVPLSGNPEAIFEVNLIPSSGEIVGDPRLKKSSGNPALDAAVERAIRKSSPLPLPTTGSPPRTITIRYRPKEE